MNQLLDRHFEVLDVGESRQRTYEGYVDKHVRPALGKLQAGRVDGETLDPFYAELRRCRERCDGRLPAHACKPLAPSTVRQIHWILSGAFERAVRWKRIAVSPTGSAEPPAPPRPNPSPPSAADATRILTKA